jgi:hypothetical protein
VFSVPTAFVGLWMLYHVSILRRTQPLHLTTPFQSRPEEHIAASSGSAAPLSNQLKAFFGPKWKDALLGNTLADGQEAGSPKALVIAASAKRCVEVLK